MNELHSDEEHKFKLDSRKCWILFVGFFLLIGALFIAAHNDSFYQKSIVKVLSIQNEFSRKEVGPNGETELYYRQEITGIIRNGEDKGKSIALKNEYSQTGYKTERYKKGDKLFVVIEQHGEAEEGKITGVKRDAMVILLIGLFIWGLILVAEKKGMMTIISVVINLGVFVFCIRFIGDPEIFAKVWMFMVIFFCGITLLLVGGLHKKTWGAMAASFITIGMVWVIYQLVIGITKEPPYELMEYISGPHEMASVFMSSAIIGSLGAVMDVAITINASVNELIVTRPEISIKELICSVREIGMDIMGTMINVLFFVYISATVTRVLLETRNGFGFTTILRFNIIFELIRFLLGAIGIVLAIPVSGVLAVVLFRGRGRTKQ